MPSLLFVTFYRVHALFVVMVLAMAIGTATAQEKADIVFMNATVITVDDATPRAQAIAVRAGKFVFVGSNEAAQAHSGQETKVIDARGKTIVPGFIDAHCHPRPAYPEDSKWALVDCRPMAVKDMEGLIAALKKKAEQIPEGEWILGSRYQTLKLGREPTRQDLDKASTKHPIIIGHASGHQSVCNTLALQRAKVTAATKDPAGGKFGRDATGEPNGLLQEGAASVVRAAITDRPDPPADVQLAAYREEFRRYLARGTTSVGVAGATPGAARLLERVRSEEVPLRLNIMLGQGSLEEAEKRAKEGRLGDENVRYGGVKLFHGGSVSAHTCWISFPYAGRPDYFGLKPARPQSTLNELILRVHQAGLQVCIHSNGDREIEMVLDAFENAFKSAPRTGTRHRLEHCAVVSDAVLRRIKDLGLVIVPHSYHWELGDTVEAFGESHWNYVHATRSMLEQGIPIAAHSDSPVSSADPLLQIQGMVTRKDMNGRIYAPGQRVTVEQALAAWTLGGAYASFEDGIKGSITVGKLADFVVLGADLTQVSPETIRNIQVEQTWLGGRKVWEAK